MKVFKKIPYGAIFSKQNGAVCQLALEAPTIADCTSNSSQNIFWALILLLETHSIISSHRVIYEGLKARVKFRNAVIFIIYMTSNKSEFSQSILSQQQQHKSSEYLKTFKIRIQWKLKPIVDTRCEKSRHITGKHGRRENARTHTEWVLPYPMCTEAPEMGYPVLVKSTRNHYHFL